VIEKIFWSRQDTETYRVQILKLAAIDDRGRSGSAVQQSGHVSCKTEVQEE
jgi:hypothetical protein